NFYCLYCKIAWWILVIYLFRSVGINTGNVSIAFNTSFGQMGLDRVRNGGGFVATLGKRKYRGTGSRNTKGQRSRLHGYTAHLVKFGNQDGTCRFDKHIVHTPPDEFIIGSKKPCYQSCNVTPLRNSVLERYFRANHLPGIACRYIHMWEYYRCV